MKRSPILAAILSSTSLFAGASSRIAGLPRGALVIERRTIPAAIHPSRTLILWMLAPTTTDHGHYNSPAAFTCPERSMGSAYYEGPTRISLFDESANRIINTVNISTPGAGDSMIIPRRIIPDFFYSVPGRKQGAEGMPALLNLRDFNGDGLPLETAFYQAQACMGLLTTLVGYSLALDRVIRYPIQLSVELGNSATTENEVWVDYLFAEKPAEPGHWKYQVDYRGRGGPLDRYDVRYDSKHERFIGTLTRIPP